MQIAQEMISSPMHRQSARQSAALCNGGSDQAVAEDSKPSCLAPAGGEMPRPGPYRRRFCSAKQLNLLQDPEKEVSVAAGDDAERSGQAGDFPEISTLQPHGLSEQAEGLREPCCEPARSPARQDQRRTQRRRNAQK